VILVEPDLFYSAQDRGPHLDEADHEDARGLGDRKKFDGQPLTSKLYAHLLRAAGVDTVVTIHNHSEKVQHTFSQVFNGAFYNLIPNDVYARYITASDMLVSGADGEQLVLCAPDEGAVPFVRQVFKSLGLSKTRCLVMEKERQGERRVSMTLSPSSEIALPELEGKDVIVLDDMVRTGATIVECCRHLRTGNPRRVCFGVTHFYASDECRENLSSRFIDEILTLNTIPSILNRDTQGRLRKKMVVLKIEKWIARFLLQHLDRDARRLEGDFYAVDMSSKNPRWPSLARV
jgi:ribose-phosphate pyrophosphokinase